MSDVLARPAPGRRLPHPYRLDELLAALGIAGETRLDQARRLGVDPGHLHRLARTGLTEEMADRLACRAGLHPGTVWPHYWWPD